MKRAWLFIALVAASFLATAFTHWWVGDAVRFGGDAGMIVAGLGNITATTAFLALIFAALGRADAWGQALARALGTSAIIAIALWVGYQTGPTETANAFMLLDVAVGTLLVFAIAAILFLRKHPPPQEIEPAG